MLDDVVDALACPHCGADLAPAGGSLRCVNNHVFDRARQGYVSLLPGRSRPGGDTAAMVAARADFLGAGHFAPIADQVAEAVAPVSGCVVDVGAGTGHYLAHVLDRDAARTGVALDSSKYACRRAAKAHARIGAVVADVWQRLPIRDAAASALLNVFAPRNPAETRRVLSPGGRLVVVTPNTEHLAELVSALGLLTVDERKQQRLQTQLGGGFEPLQQRRVHFTMSLAPAEIEAVAAMGPSAWHANPDALRRSVEALPDPFDVTASVTVSTYRPREKTTVDSGTPA